MPTVLLVNGYRFYFYMNEHPPVHIHISKGGGKAKFNLIPQIDVISNKGFKANEMKEIVNLLREHQGFIIKKWHETFD